MNPLACMTTALTACLRNLLASLSEMRAPTTPYVALPRFRSWTLGMSKGRPLTLIMGEEGTFSAKIIFPGWGPTSALMLDPSNCDYTASLLIEELRAQPKLVLRAIRRLEAATEWANRMKAVREKQAEQIFRDQSSSMEHISAMTALEAMSNPSGEDSPHKHLVTQDVGPFRYVYAPLRRSPVFGPNR